MVVFSFQGTTMSYAEGVPEEKRPVRVADSIGMTWIGERKAEFQVDTNSVLFAPDGQSFAVITRRGNLVTDCNDYSLLYFRKASPGGWILPPQQVVKMSSSSNSPGIDNVKWLADGKTLMFIGARGDEKSQIFSVDISTGELRQLTVHPTDVLSFDATLDLNTLAFEARPQVKWAFDSISKRRGIVINEEPLEFLLSGRTLGNINVDPPELFVKSRGRPLSQIPVPEGESFHSLNLALSPNGRYLSIASSINEPDIPTLWKDYRQSFVGWGSIAVYRVLNVETGSMHPLLDAPAGYGISGISMAWTSDSRSVIVNSYLPLDTSDDEERELRRRMPFKVEVEIGSRKIRKIWPGTCALASWDARSEIAILRPQDPGSEQFSIGCDHGTLALKRVSGFWRQVAVAPAVTTMQPRVSVEQGMNSPPRLIAVEPENGARTVLLDPNPQFAMLDLATVEEIDFQGSDGTPWKAGVYLPPGAKAGQRYPLVIQTHGWNRQRFEIDGESTAGYAAQALAAAGMMVAQLPYEVQDQNTVSEGPKSMAQFQGLMDELDRRGLIDRRKVGLQGWSSTGYAARYALSFSKYPIAAALIADGMEAGYVQYMLDSKFSTAINATFEALNGGAPFGQGLEVWLKNSPMFHLEDVHTPVLQFMLGPYSYRNMWESFTALRRLCKPVEMLYLPESNHWPLRPSERLAVQGRAVDWFRFWLKDEEDADPSKTEQYMRWRKLRVLQEADQRGHLRTPAAVTQLPGTRGCPTF
jgi:hypothetical protein